MYNRTIRPLTVGRSLVAIVIVCVACSTEPRTGGVTARLDTPYTAISTERDSLSAINTLEEFLSLSVATRTQKIGMFDSVYTVGGEANATVYDPCPEDLTEVRWLADYRIVGVQINADSATATAVITTVARQVADTAQGTYIVTPEIREQTAHWTMIKSRDRLRQWRVCGDATEHFGLSMVGRNLIWRRGSVAAAKAVIDSIRNARGLSVIR